MNLPGSLMGFGAITLILLAVASPAMAANWQNQTANQSAGTCPMQADCTGAGISHMHRFQNTTAGGSDMATPPENGAGQENMYRFQWEHTIQSGTGIGAGEGLNSAGNGPKSGTATGTPNGNCNGDCTRDQGRDRAQLQDGSCGNCTRS